MTTLVLVVLSLWWPRHPTVSALAKATAAFLVAVALFLHPRILSDSLEWPDLRDIGSVRFDVLILTNFKMIITFAAVAW